MRQGPLVPNTVEVTQVCLRPQGWRNLNAAANVSHLPKLPGVWNSFSPQTQPHRRKLADLPWESLPLVIVLEQETSSALAPAASERCLQKLYLARSPGTLDVAAERARKRIAAAVEEREMCIAAHARVRSSHRRCRAAYPLACSHALCKRGYAGRGDDRRGRSLERSQSEAFQPWYFFKGRPRCLDENDFGDNHPEALRRMQDLVRLAPPHRWTVRRKARKYRPLD